MLNSFRSFSGSIVTKILLGLLILSFAMWGIGDMLRGGGRDHAVATVGNKDISVESYYRELVSESENVRRQLGASYSPELLKRLNVPQFVLQRMVQQSLLSQEATRMGFIPDDVHVALAIRSNPEFLNHSGTFDKARFENALRNRGTSEKSFAEDLRMQMTIDGLLGALNIDFPLTDKMLTHLHAARNEGRMVTAYKITNKDSISTPSEDMLINFHREHPELFTSPEYRTVSFTRFSAENIEASTPALTSVALNNYYLAHQDQFHTPEKREVEQLIYNSEDKAQEAYTQLKQGKNFAEVAAQTAPLNKTALSLGLVTRNGVIENAADKIFQLKAGEFTELVRSPFGFHIFRVSKIEPVGVEPFEKVRDVIIKSLNQERRETLLTDKINQIEDTLAGGSTLEEATQQMGLKLEQAGTFDKFGNTPEGVANKKLPALDNFIDVAFKTAEKTESVIVSSKNGIYYVLRIDKLTPSVVRPLAEVKNEVIQAYLQQQNERKSADLASLIETEMAAKKSAQDIISTHGLEKIASGKIMRDSKTLSSFPLPSSLVSQAFTRSISALTAPVKDKQNNYLLLLVDAIAPADAEKIDSSQLSKDIAGQMQEELVVQYLQYLETQTPVKIHTAVLDQLLKSSDVAN